MLLWYNHGDLSHLCGRNSKWFITGNMRFENRFVIKIWAKKCECERGQYRSKTEQVGAIREKNIRLENKICKRVKKAKKKKFHFFDQFCGYTTIRKEVNWLLSKSTP